MKKFWEGVVTVEGEKVGTFKAEYETSQEHRPEHLHHHCPGCGKLWASMTLEGAGVNQYHRVISNPCEACGGGLLWLYVGTDRQKAPFTLDVDVLKRDFMVISGKYLEGKSLHKNTRIHLL